jgi:hypothetical protein
VFDLVPIDVPDDGALVPAEIEAARGFAEAAIATSTIAGYEADWRAFRLWCGSRALSALPADPRTVAAWLASMAGAGIRASTLGRKVASLKYAHRLAGLASPTSSALVRTRSFAVTGTRALRFVSSVARKSPSVMSLRTL